MDEAVKKLSNREHEYIEQCCHELFDSLTECFGLCFDDVDRDSGNAIYNAIGEFYIANKGPPPQQEKNNDIFRSRQR